MTALKSEPWTVRIPVQPADPRPIWCQIEDGMRRLLVSGTLAVGDPAPSVRELAMELRINPATVSRAYQALVTAGLFEVRRGEGTFVSAAPPSIRKSEQARLIKQAAMTFTVFAISHGADRKMAREAVDGAWDDLGRQERVKP
jgi:GntR family transcriptional regulator